MLFPEMLYIFDPGRLSAGSLHLLSVLYTNLVMIEDNFPQLVFPLIEKCKKIPVNELLGPPVYFKKGKISRQ